MAPASASSNLGRLGQVVKRRGQTRAPPPVFRICGKQRTCKHAVLDAWWVGSRYIEVSAEWREMAGGRGKLQKIEGLRNLLLFRSPGLSRSCFFGVKRR